MNIRAIQIVLLALTLLAACGSRPTSVSPTSTSWVLEEGESGRLPIEAGGEPTVETPYLQLKLDVTDRQTGQHVDSAVIAVDGHDLGRGCCLTVMIEATGPHTLTVEAAGYAPWSVELNPHIQHHTVMTAPVELEPLKPEADLPTCTGRSEVTVQLRRLCTLPRIPWSTCQMPL
ncbi:MAG: hypothetical protein JW850_12425 [Thermoflexales bacterium]|nr:hypothetical protein [Thermoflexales bacterium]